MNNDNKQISIKPETLEKKSATRNSLFRLFLVVLAVLFQAYIMYYMIYAIQERYTWIEPTSRVVALVLAVILNSMNKASSFKAPWMLLVLAFPVAGIIIFLIVGLNRSPKKMRKRFEAIDEALFPLIPQDPGTMQRMEECDMQAANMSRYIRNYAGYPVYDDSDITYYSDASEALEAQKQELRRAKEFIFMEYHAIEDGESFNGIVDILAEKAAEGVDVRLFYDDMGSIGFINPRFVRKMEDLGIQCRIFNPVTPFVNLFLNNRDHRKITVIDGLIGFTGGYNLANEYFNLTHPYGLWKDTGVKITGPAVRSFTVMFLEMWNAIRATDQDDFDYNRYFPEIPEIQREKGAIIQPYADSPLDSEHVGENVYLNIISAAKDYVWFITPYLIITDEMNRMLGVAAKRGVDVRIMTPGIPDKRTVYGVTRSYYQRLVNRGVRIFEYTPGFCHAKQCISDDKVATCGTINLDYRSLYHHFENGVLMMNCDAIRDMKRDFEETFQDCEEVTEKYRRGQSILRRAWSNILCLLAPLM